MSWRDKSLRRRLALWVIIPLAIVSAIMLMDVRESSRKAANEAYDRVLLGSALAIAERVVIEGNKILVDVPYIALEMLTSAAQDRVFYQVAGPGEKFITGYADLPKIPEHLTPLRSDPVFYDVQYKGETVRIGAVVRVLSSPKLSARVVIKVAETVEARNALIGELITGAAFRQALLILVATIIVWVGLGRGLKPLSRLEEALNRRNPEDLHPIDHEVPFEVRNLIGAINHLMARLSNSIDAMQRFTANAAHQLRTPLAAIKTQTEIALRHQDPEETQQTLAHLHDSAEQTTRLINQLMSLARATPGEGSTVNQEFDIRQLCIEVTSSMVPIAIENKIDLGFEGSDEALVITGDPTLFEELLRNLTHNAISYCPSGSHTSVRVLQHNGAAIIEVEDNGPGIPESEREAAFERFHRLPSANANGCGLGLSIVQEIARQQGGDAIILSGQNGSGTLARVTVPINS